MIERLKKRGYVPPIEVFRDSYAFLSNFYRKPIVVGNVTYLTAEHYFQSCKCQSRADFLWVIEAPTPAEAKRRGRQVVMCDDWEQRKEDVMRQVLKHKFADEDLRRRLLDTGRARLIEGNSWGDMYWGVCRGKGKNRLGVLLMELRDNLRTA